MTMLRALPAKGIVFAHPSYAATDNGNIVFLESFVDGIPDQATPDHDSAGSCIVGHLGKPSGVDLDSLGRGESGICGMTTALHLKHRRVRHASAWITSMLTANGICAAPITRSCHGKAQFSKSGMPADAKRTSVRFCPHLPVCRVRPRT